MLVEGAARITARRALMIAAAVVAIVALVWARRSPEDQPPTTSPSASDPRAPVAECERFLREAPGCVERMEPEARPIRAQWVEEQGAHFERTRSMLTSSQSRVALATACKVAHEEIARACPPRDR
jgi:hypothetical protein